MNKINNLSNHYVIIGFGRMGKALCVTLAYRPVPCVRIESDEVRILEAEQLGYSRVRGDAMHEETLLLGGLDRAADLTDGPRSNRGSR